MPTVKRSSRIREKNEKNECAQAPSDNSNSLSSAHTPCATKQDSERTLCPCGKDTTDRWIECSSCNQWYHTGCLGLSEDTVNKFDGPDRFYFCPRCTFSSIAQHCNPSIINFAVPCLKNYPNITSVSKSTPTDEPEQTHVSCGIDEIVDAPLHSSIDNGSQEEHIVILDNIDEQGHFLTRKKIVTEVKKTKPDINVRHAYPLAGGGIALHLCSEFDKEKALQPWPINAFNSPNLAQHKPASESNITKVYIKQVPYNTSVKDIKDSTPDAIRVERLKASGSQLQSKTIAITIEKNAVHKLVATGLDIQGINYIVSPKRSIKVFRCYKCQQFGHTGKTCKNKTSCAYCSLEHDSGICNSVIVKCANCGDNHPAYSRDCKVYKILSQKLHSIILWQHEHLTDKCQITQHIGPIDQGLCQV